MQTRYAFNATFLIATCLWSFAARAQQTEFDPVSVTLSYIESVEVETPADDDCGGGGIFGAMDCIGKRIDGTVGDGEATVEMIETGAARVTYTITPVLLPVPNTESFQVRIRVEAGSPVITGEIDSQSQTDVTADARLVRERLRRWRLMLDDDQVSYLRQGDTLSLPIATPFAGLKRLQPEDDAVINVFMPSGDILRSIEVIGRIPKTGEDDAAGTDAGFTETKVSGIDGNIPFRVQMTYDDAPDSPPLSVTLRWQGGGQRVAVERTRDAKVFTSTWYVISPESMRDLRGDGRMRGSDESWAKEAAAKFAGNWNVSHAGGEFGDATGVAYVSDDGSNVRLFLKSPDKTARYESVEILATWDDTNNGHTLDVRFQRKGDDEAWGPPLAMRAPEGRVIYVTEGITKMTAEARDRREQVDVELPEGPADRFRASLMNRGEAGLRMSGAWNVERSDGSLGSDAMQTWGMAPRIEGVVVLEEQRPPPRKLGNYESFQADDNPTSAKYIYEAPANDANRSTDYPFRRNAQNDSTKRTLMVYGYNLPQRGSEALFLDSEDGHLSYELLAFPGEGHDALFEKGWKKQRERAEKATAAATAAGEPTSEIALREADPGDKTALMLTATMTEGVLAGVKGLTVNAAGGAWHLDFADSNVFPQFATLDAEDMGSGEPEFLPAEAVYLNNEIFITLHEQSPLPYESLQLRLLVNGVEVDVIEAKRHEVDERCASDSDSTAAVKAQIGCQPPYRTQAIKLLRRELVETSPLNTYDNFSIHVSPDDRIEAEITNPFLVRSAPARVAAQVIVEPGDLGATWKDALQRVAVCLNETAVDFDTMTNEESDVYSNFIFTENLLQLAWPQFFGLPESRKIQITKGDHAAGILIRDQFLGNLNNAIPDLMTTLTDDEKMWQFFQTRASSNMPFWDLMTVDSGPGITNLYVEWAKESALELTDMATPDFIQDWLSARAGMFTGDGQATNDGDWLIGDLVESITSHPDDFSNSRRHSYLFAFRMTKVALRLLIDRASFAYARASNAGDCNVEELMMIAGQEANGLVAQILPRLVRRSDDGAANLWVPDVVARSYVRSLKVKGAEIRALEAYGRIDEAYQAMALAAVTAGAAAALSASGAAVAGSYLMLAADTADIIIYGSESLNQYVASQPLIDYAEGATAGGFSRGFYDEAVAMRAEGWEAAVGLLAPALGVATGVGAIGDVAAARRGKQVLDGMDTITKEAIEGLIDADQRALFSYFGDLQNRRPGSSLRDINNLGQVHNAAEGVDYAKFADHFAESGLDVTGSTMRQRFYGASATDEAVAGRAGVDDLFDNPVSVASKDPLDNAPSTVRVTDEVDGRTVRAESENMRGLDDLSDPAETTGRRTARNGDDPDVDTVRTSDDTPTRTTNRDADSTDTVRTRDNTPTRTTNNNTDRTNPVRTGDNTPSRTTNNNPDTPNTVRTADDTPVRPARNDPDVTADTVRASDDTLRADADTIRTADNTTVRPARNDPDVTADTVRASDDTLRADADTVRTGDNTPVRAAGNDPDVRPARTTGDAADPNGPYIGFDERLGPDANRAMLDDPAGPYPGLDERLGPEFRGALDDDAATPAARNADMPDDTFGPATSDTPDTARVNAGPSDWKADLENTGDVTIVGPDGVSRKLNFGERRGRGVSAGVYKDGDEASGVLRVREYDDVSVYNRINDDVGRAKMQSVLDANPDADFVRLAEMRGQVKVESSSNPQLKGKMVEYVEEVESTADARIAAQGGIPTEGASWWQWTRLNACSIATVLYGPTAITRISI